MINKISYGDTFEHPFSFAQSQVVQFAEVTGDDNPVHLDDQFAEKTIFKRRIIHGFLGGSVFSKILGTLFPGEGTIYLKQSLQFLKPMYTEITYVAKIKVLDVLIAKGRAVVETKVVDPEGVEVIIGEATVFNELLKQ